MADSKTQSSERVEAKLAELMTSGPVSDKENFNEYRRLEYKLRKLKKEDPALYAHHVREVTLALAGLKAVVIDAEVQVEWGFHAALRELARQKGSQKTTA